MSETSTSPSAAPARVVPTQTVDTVVIRFAGDSGDGMQLTGSRFTTEAALFGNDLRTLPDFPAEIRAPAGTLAGVSAFQLSFSHLAIQTPGDTLDVLVAMNPAALKVNLADLRPGGVLIVNTAQFHKRNLEKAGYAQNPLEDGSLKVFVLHGVDITQLTTNALDDLGLPPRTVDRCKNFFALGLVFWMYHRELMHTLKWIDDKFKKDADIAEANRRALKAGFFYGETAEAFTHRYEVRPAPIEPGTYRNIAGNSAVCLGLLAAARAAKTELFLGSYPITPASDILHELSTFKNFGVRTFQAEDEIAGITSAIGASFAGALAVTTTSGPGLALKGEGLGLALMVELPLVVVNVQRGGPSTGLPTKTEQADLLQSLFGRNSEAPVPVIAASSPGDCFFAAYEASRIAMKYMTPVILLSDGYLANGSEPWKIPDLSALTPFDLHDWEAPDGFHEGFHPYLRDPMTLARPRVRLGTPGLEHRIGGLEKEHITGNVSYDPENHELMVRLRNEKVQRVAQEIPATEIYGDKSGDLLFVGWGSTQGAIIGATDRLRAAGKRVSAVHLRYLNPLPSDLTSILKRFRTVVVPELNMGQLAMVLRARTLIDIKSICKIQGQPFKVDELVEKATAHLAGAAPGPFLIETLERLEAVQPALALRSAS